jgi:hypothetical protein
MKISEEKKKAIDELWRFDGCYNEQIKTILNLIEKLQKENEELKEYIMLAPNLDEMTAIKYRNIQEEAYIRGRMEEQQKSEQIIYENYIPIQKVKDKIEELKQYKFSLLKEDYAKKQKEFKSQNVLVCNTIRDIVATGKIDILKEIIGDK